MTHSAILEPALRSSRAVSLASSISYAFQPIVDSNSGAVYAYEALVRGTERAGHASIEDFFDVAAAEERLWATECALQELALTTFRRLRSGAPKLFLNIDGRAFSDPEFDPRLIADAAERLGVSASSVVVELTEKHAPALPGQAVTLARSLRSAGLGIALDDFGQGYSELSLLYESAPEYVKIDQFFVAAIATSPRKRLFVTTIVNLAHVLGCRVVAEGVETEEEFIACREIGCDLIQGWFIARAMGDIAGAPSTYLLPSAIRSEESQTSSFRSSDFQNVAPIRVDQSMRSVFEQFRTSPDVSAFPVIAEGGAPLGLVREKELRAYVYSQFGTELLSNKAIPRGLDSFLIRVPTVELGCSIEIALENIAQAGASDGLIITEGGKYHGYISAQALLTIINERRLLAAQDQNPLSHLPGNTSINAHILALAGSSCCDRVFCYFDFNHFKPFNDIYGFRLGDRAIMLFASIMRRHLDPFGGFLGHIGGDDFFAAFTYSSFEEIEAATNRVLADFRTEIQSFYAPGDREKGFLESEDRNGRPQIYPLMTCSAAIMRLPSGYGIRTLDSFSKVAAEVKRAAKISPTGCVSRTIGERLFLK